MQIVIDRKQLKAVSLFAGTKDIRYYLNGVFVVANKMQSRLVATDGHTCGIAKRDSRDENDGAAQFIIPNDAVKQILAIKPVRGLNSDDVVITVPDDFAENINQELRATFHTSGVIFKAIDGKFPDYQRIIPSELSGETGHFNAEYLYRCKKAALCFGKEYFGFAMNGENCALASINSEMIAVIMPVRKDAHPKCDVTDAAWAKEALPELPAVVAETEQVAA